MIEKFTKGLKASCDQTVAQMRSEIRSHNLDPSLNSMPAAAWAYLQDLRRAIPDGFPKIITLCGSTRFKDDYERVMREETLKGHLVISVGLFGHVEGLDMSGDVKKKLDVLHLRKIDLADEVLFINPGDYLGESSRRELAYARVEGKEIRFMEPHTEVGA
jgi:hypothetical protein